MYTLDERRTISFHISEEERYIVRPNGTVRYFVEGTSKLGHDWASIAQFDRQRHDPLPSIFAIELIGGSEGIPLQQFSRGRRFHSLQDAYEFAKALAQNAGYKV